MSQSRVVIRFNHIPSERAEMRATSTKFIRALAFETKRYIQQSFGTSPSPAGGPPGVDTGALRAEISTKATGVLRSEVSSSMAYSFHLEFGTSKMGARPFMVPGLLWAGENAGRVAQEMRWTRTAGARKSRKATE
jgi:hypothetical protein